VAIFVGAGITDGLDGWIAKKFNCVTRLGSILDPIADKVLIVSTYVVLVLLGDLPFWLLLLIVFRDLGIIGGYLILDTLHDSVPLHPSFLSKVNTLLQIILVAVVLIDRAGWVHLPWLNEFLIVLVGLTTLISGIHYGYLWFIRGVDFDDTVGS
ncbi:MAG: CDP-alcohol phosphatidyltransferase family protein, partial [Pseudomonadota bacterium]|nr:CDP-alcohol phosphatidyltransferase family protein [Pseudomonadota bacterium]